MPVKMVELDTWLDEWDDGAVTEGIGSREPRIAPAESSHVIERLLEALTNPDALTPFIENLALWTAACDHLQTCEICRSGLAALAAIGDTPEGALGALMAHAAQDPARLATPARRARRPRSASRKRASARASFAATAAAPAPDASALASYIAIVQNTGVATAAKQLPDVARHLRGCPRCRRDVSDALAALQSLEVSEPQK